MFKTPLIITRLQVNLKDIPKVNSWLAQFDVPDVYIAEHMLRRLRYVGFEEFETWVQKSLTELLQDIEAESGRVAIAICPVTKETTHQFNEEKEVKSANDSSGRIGHALKNLERNLPDYIEVSPRLDSMRERKVKHIIYVDDLIGTGTRFLKFWKNQVPQKIKSWCSLGWCKVWLVTFAAHTSGKNKLARYIHALPTNRIKIGLEIEKSAFLENENIKTVLRKYGATLTTKSSVMGYGNLATPIVFQHGCPNNVPAIFCLRSSKSKHTTKTKWQPLFPNRSVDTDLYPLFNSDINLGSLPEELWMAKHYQSAINILERVSDFSNNHYLLLVLGLLDKNYAINKIRNIIVLEHSAFNSILNDLYEGGLIDQSNKVTLFGKDILNRISKPAKVSVKIKQETNFFPSSFLGLQRET